MRVMIDLPDPLFRKVMDLCARQATTLSQFIGRVVEHEISRIATRLESRRVEFPLIRSKRLGSVRVTPELTAGLIEREDLERST